LTDWLLAQPKPLAVLACNDSRARECAQICEDLSIHVPSEIAILGVDNDDLFCRLSHPPLSSVMVPWEKIGYRAAELLDRRIEGKSVPRGLSKIPPSGVVERQSTDVIAVADADLRAALHFIRTNSTRPITVEDVAEAVPLSRRDLEQRFRKLLKRSPLEEIRSAHLSRAKMLLATTDMTVDEVALASGFVSVNWFDKVFKQFLNSTPSAYRRQMRNQR
jgi:LacI family transcriptional regulator